MPRDIEAQGYHSPVTEAALSRPAYYGELLTAHAWVRRSKVAP